MVETQPATLLAILADKKDPIVSFTGKTMSRRNRRDGSAVDRDRRSAGKGAETRINHTTNAIDVDCEEHMLPHAFVAGFEHSKAYKVWAKEWSWSIRARWHLCARTRFFRHSKNAWLAAKSSADAKVTAT